MIVGTILLLVSIPVFLVWSVRSGHAFPLGEKVVVGALLGGIVAGLCQAIAFLTKTPLTKQAQSMLVVGTVGFFAAYSGRALNGISWVVDPTGEEMRGFGERLASLPEFSAWRAQVGPNIKAEMTQATARGRRRLDDATLTRQLVVTSKMQDKADIHRCAALGRGVATGEDIQYLLDGLSSDDRAVYFEISFRAAEASIKKQPMRRWLGPQKRDEFYGALWNEIGKRPDGKKVMATLENVAEASDEEVCQASRAVSHAASLLPDALGRLAGLVLINDGGAAHPLLEGRWLSVPDEALITRAEILGNLLQSTSEAKCAALARGTVSDEEVDALIGKLPAELQIRWLLAKDKLAGAKGEDRRLTKDEFKAFAVAHGKVTGDDLNADVYFSPDRASDSEACRAHRLFVAAVLRLPPPLRAFGARLIAGGSPPE